MKSKQLLEIMKSKTISVPLYLFRLKETLKLDSDTFFLLFYLINEGERVLFNPAKFETDLNIKTTAIMEMISILTEKSLISLEVSKNEIGIMEEFISLEGFWNKVTKIMIEEINEENNTDTTIYEKIQTEFGRMLSPIECEIIGAWIESNTSEELIYEAVKEAVFNGVNNLRYIDKILYEWGKKGYKTKKDVETKREKWKSEKRETNQVKKEVFDYNWLEDDEDD